MHKTIKVQNIKKRTKRTLAMKIVQGSPIEDRVITKSIDKEMSAEKGKITENTIKEEIGMREVR